MKSFPILLGLLTAASTLSAQQYTIFTAAGIGTAQGYFGDTGPATSAQLDFPLRVTVDSKGNYYFVDFLTQVIREVSNGYIKTIAGNGTYGFQGDNGSAVQAEISDVHGIAVGPNGHVYIADTHNARVREIVPGGNIYTLAGNGTVGYTGDGAAATKAELSVPSGVAVDSAGNVYIADYGNAAVRKVDSKGNISTIAGTGSWGYSGDGGPANKAALAGPYALTFDPSGNLYISDLGNTNIREITTDGNIHTVLSNVSAESIAVDAAGSIYFPSYQSSTVQKVLANGTKFTIAGTGSPGFSGDKGPGTRAQLNQPYGLALDGSGDVYVADSGNQVIRLLIPVASTITVVSAASGSGSTISPGEIITVFGTGIGPDTPAVAAPGMNGFFGTLLAGTTVSVGGVYAPMIYASSSQVSAIVPYAAIAGTSEDVVVSYQGQSSTASAVPVVATAPGLFTYNASGSGPVAAVNQNGTINSATSPAPLGSIVAFYLTGEGATSPAGIDGKPATAPYPTPLGASAAWIAGQPAVVTYAGGAPGLVAGLMQMNVQIPSGVAQNFTGTTALPVSIQLGNQMTQPNVTVYVKR
ncbi:MAG: hypothetical protein M3N93_06150 [Acidobacteriota bacterium]|nr:hypothetical protein [Acidobacteriota bacterium]